MSKKYFLITGAGGQLAKAFAELLKNKGIPFKALLKSECDITDYTSLEKAVVAFKPDVLINTAAYNHVEDADKNPETAFKVNQEGVSHCAKICKDNNIF